MTNVIYKYLIKPLYKTKHDGEGDPYETGTRHASDQPLVFIDPTKIDLVKFKEANDKLAIESQAALGKTLPVGASDLEKRQYFKELEAKAPEIWNRYSESIASLIRPQIDAASPELSNRFSVQDLVELTHGVLTSGPAAAYIPEAGVCLVVKPTDDKIFSLTEWLDRAGFDEKHILSPMTPEQLEIIKEAVGRHEGEHCNQGNSKENSLYEIFVKEYQSDLKLLELIREKDPSLAQQIADSRILRGANGDAHHAGLMFGSDPSKIPSKEQFDAIQELQSDMNAAVADQSGLSLIEAKYLQTKDPQAYADFVKSAIDNGEFPVRKLTAASIEKQKELIAAEMGITTTELENLDKEKVTDFIKAYDKLVASGAFIVEVTNKNPHAIAAAQAYVDATRRMFIPDTTPATSVAPVTTPAPPPAAPPPAEPPTAAPIEPKAAPPPAAPIEPKAEPRALEPSAVPSSLPSSPPKIHTSSAEPIVIPKHGRAEIVASDVSDQIKIGGLSAAAYFQSFAHPELAQQRIEEQALTRQFALTSPPPAITSNQLLGAKA